jgi:hypothetical protein
LSSPTFAADFTITGNSTDPQTLAAGETGVIKSGAL